MTKYYRNYNSSNLPKTRYFQVVYKPDITLSFFVKATDEDEAFDQAGKKVRELNEALKNCENVEVNERNFEDLNYFVYDVSDF